MSSIGNKEIFARNLKYYLGVTEKTQKEIAQYLQVNPSSVNDWVKAKKYPRIDKIELLAIYFGILKSDLIEDKGMDKTLPQIQTLTEGETMLLELFRQIPKEQQKVFLDMGRVYADSLKKD